MGTSKCGCNRVGRGFISTDVPMTGHLPLAVHDTDAASLHNSPAFTTWRVFVTHGRIGKAENVYHTKHTMNNLHSDIFCIFWSYNVGKPEK